MKNRNFILFLLLIFFAICGVNIYYTISRISTDYELANKTPEKRTDWLKDADNAAHYKTAIDNSFSLGLDLQGGMFITMEVGVDEVVANMAENTGDSTFRRALAIARVQKKESQESFVDLFVKALKKENPTVRLATYFANPNTGLQLSATDNQVISKLEKETSTAIDNSYGIIRRRIDQFGVTSPNLQLQKGSGRILIELPGVNDAKRVRSLLRGTARLEFWPTYTVQEAFPYVLGVNNKLKSLTAPDTSKAGKDSTKLAEKKAAADTTKSVAEALGQKPAATPDKGKTKKDTLSKDEKHKKFDRENPFFAYLRPPQNDVQANSPVVGYALVNDTAKVDSMLRLPEVHNIIPTDMLFFWSAKPLSEQNQYLSLLAIKSNREGKAPLGGDAIADAQQEFEPNSSVPVVSMRMTSEGAKRWKKLTGDNLKKSIAVVLDNAVYTFPTVNNVIANGSSQISGRFSLEEAKDLANVLKAGKLPAPASIQGEEIVGPTLGSDTIQKGVLSFFLAFAVVIAFVLLYYRGSGVIAAIALVVNLFMVLGISGAFHIVLTLPGIAGIVLTMAMAVDANVLIFERIREELEGGRTFRAAVNAGFKNALSAIIDGNLTAFLTGAILFFFGTGPVRGFAVTLMIGIATTLIAALLITRLILSVYTSRSEAVKISFGNPAASHFFKSRNIPIAANRRLYYGIVGLVVVASFAAILTLGFKLGVDFEGGRQYIIEFNQQPQVETLRTDLTQVFKGNTPVIKTIGAKNQVMVTTSYRYTETNDNTADQVKAEILQGLQPHFAANKPQIIKSTTVGPTVAADIRTGAYWSLSLSLLGIFLYIFLRFARWELGIGAVVSLAFNVAAVLGLFALLGHIENLPFSVELDQSFIAAILTVVGYTINDTVVVFDRIRETVGSDTDPTHLPALYTKAVNDTLSRTIITSTTTLLTTVVLFFFGGDVLKGFMLALFFGIVVGTLSSIFLASPLSLDLILRQKRRQNTVKAQPQRVTA